MLTPEQAVRTWTKAVFQPEEVESAVQVAKRESRWKPYVCYDWHTKEDKECQPPLVSKTNGVRGSCFQGKQCSEGGTATGLFQHRWNWWPEREQKARIWLAETHQIIIEEPLDIWNGWHSTIVAAWLIYEGGGWTHFHSCASGARHAKKHQGVGGGGWVKTC